MEPNTQHMPEHTNESAETINQPEGPDVGELRRVLLVEGGLTNLTSGHNLIRSDLADANVSIHRNVVLVILQGGMPICTTSYVAEHAIRFRGIEVSADGWHECANLLRTLDALTHDAKHVMRTKMHFHNDGEDTLEDSPITIVEWRPTRDDALFTMKGLIVRDGVAEPWEWPWYLSRQSHVLPGTRDPGVLWCANQEPWEYLHIVDPTAEVPLSCLDEVRMVWPGSVFYCSHSSPDDLDRRPAYPNGGGITRPHDEHPGQRLHTHLVMEKRGKDDCPLGGWYYPTWRHCW